MADFCRFRNYNALYDGWTIKITSRNEKRSAIYLVSADNKRWEILARQAPHCHIFLKEKYISFTLVVEQWAVVVTFIQIISNISWKPMQIIIHLVSWIWQETLWQKNLYFSSDRKTNVFWFWNNQPKVISQKTIIKSVYSLFLLNSPLITILYVSILQ